MFQRLEVLQWNYLRVRMFGRVERALAPRSQRLGCHLRMRCHKDLFLLGSLLPWGAVPCLLGPLSAFCMYHHICVMRALWALDIFVHFFLSSCILGKSTLARVLNLEPRGACTPLQCGCVCA